MRSIRMIVDGLAMHKGIRDELFYSGESVTIPGEKANVFIENHADGTASGVIYQGGEHTDLEGDLVQITDTALDALK